MGHVALSAANVVMPPTQEIIFHDFNDACLSHLVLLGLGGRFLVQTIGFGCLHVQRHQKFGRDRGFYLAGLALDDCVVFVEHGFRIFGLGVVVGANELHRVSFVQAMFKEVKLVLQLFFLQNRDVLFDLEGELKLVRRMLGIDVVEPAESLLKVRAEATVQHVLGLLIVIRHLLFHFLPQKVLLYLFYFKFQQRTLIVEVFVNLVLVKLLLKLNAVEEALVALLIRAFESMEARRLRIPGYAGLMRKNKLDVFLVGFSLAIHAEQDFGRHHVGVEDELLLDLVLLHAGDEEVLNQFVRILVARARILHFTLN